MCSWATDEARARVLRALAAEDREEAARVLVEETGEKYAAALVAELLGDVEQVRKDPSG